MRCIEIWRNRKVKAEGEKININMRCIEIVLVNDNACQIHGLTLTWDVLK